MTEIKELPVLVMTEIREIQVVEEEVAAAPLLAPGRTLEMLHCFLSMVPEILEEVLRVSEVMAVEVDREPPTPTSGHFLEMPVDLENLETSEI